jgi:hypothetical protein
MAFFMYRPKQNPTGQDIERFLIAMVDVTKLRYHNSTALSYSWMFQGTAHVVKSCVFEYPDFKLLASAKSRISALFATFLKEGRITKDLMRKKQWIGSFIIQRIVTTLLRDAIIHGTHSWDVTIARAASLVLVSALGRSGDVVRSNAYDNLVCLCYKDVTIKLVENGDSDIQFTALFEMAQDKGKK